MSYFSPNCGHSLSTYEFDRPMHNVSFHPFKKDSFLASAYMIPKDNDYQAENLQLWVTHDKGNHFEKLADYVHLFEWINDSEEGYQSNINPDRIIVIQDKLQGKEIGQYVPEML